jgi:hypothetical protein
MVELTSDETERLDFFRREYARREIGTLRDYLCFLSQITHRYIPSVDILENGSWNVGELHLAILWLEKFLGINPLEESIIEDNFSEFI